jgi:glycine/sarcosine N-methyltransferase
VGLAERTASNGLVATFLKSVIPESSFVLDAASGIGCESAVLINAGYAVVSNEIDANLAQVAEELAQKDFGVKLDLRRYLWEELADNLPGGVRFDAVLCLGNSLCLVDSDEGRRRSLQSFRQVLRKGGALIIDERNYRYMIEHRQQIRKSPMTFPAVTKDPMYAGRQVRGMPVEISEQQIVWRLFDADHVRTLSEMKARARGRPLYLYPFKYGELYELLIDAGFSCVTVYADLELVSSGAMPEYAAVQNAVFYTYVAT